MKKYLYSILTALLAVFCFDGANAATFDYGYTYESYGVSNMANSEFK